MRLFVFTDSNRAQEEVSSVGRLDWFCDTGGRLFEGSEEKDFLFNRLFLVCIIDSYFFLLF